MTACTNNTRLSPNILSKRTIGLCKGALKAGLAATLTILGALEVLDSFAPAADQLFTASPIGVNHFFGAAELSAAALLLISTGKKVTRVVALSLIIAYFGLRASL